MIKLKLFFIFCCFLSLHAVAQNGSVSITPISYDQAATNFCGPLQSIVTDAQAGFAKTKGKEIETNGNTTLWSANMGIPGTVTSSLLYVSSWRYEGVMYLGSSADDMQSYYNKYKNLLEACLTEYGYERTTEKNMETKLEKYPELRYTKPSGQAAPVYMKVEYTESSGIYTLTVNIEEAGR